jgi:hypothetical protein
MKYLNQYYSGQEILLVLPDNRMFLTLFRRSKKDPTLVTATSPAFSDSY